MKKVLIIDDEPEILEVLKFRVSNWGYNPVTASSGQEALARIPEENPDLILLDVMMPGMDGYEVLKRLKASPAMRNIPVIMITVMASKTDIQKGLTLGAEFYLVKPYDASELQSRLRQVLGEEQ